MQSLYSVLSTNVSDNDSNGVVKSSRRGRRRANVLGWQWHASSNDVVRLVGSLIAMALGTSARCTSAIIVNESMTVDGVGGEVVAVTVGVCVSVKNWVIVSLPPFPFGGIAWTIICNVYSVVVNVASS